MPVSVFSTRGSGAVYGRIAILARHYGDFTDGSTPFPRDELCIHGKELRRLRIAAGLPERALARKIGWYKKKRER